MTPTPSEMAFDPDFELFKLATGFFKKKFLEKKFWKIFILEKKISQAHACTSFEPKKLKSAIKKFPQPPSATTYINYFLRPRPPAKIFMTPSSSKELAHLWIATLTKARSIILFQLVTLFIFYVQLSLI